MTNENKLSTKENKINWRKKVKINYSRSEYVKKYKSQTITSNSFKERLDNMINQYNIDKANLKRDNIQEAEYEIQYDIADLFCIMLKDFTQNPLYDGRDSLDKVTATNIIDYNNTIIKDIENLPDYLKFFIKNDENFKFNYALSKYAPLLLDRLTLLFATITLFSNSSSGNIMIDLIKSIDQWIDQYFTHYNELENYKNNSDIPILNISASNEINLESNAGYSIDLILERGFKKFYRNDNSFNSNIPKDLLDNILKNETKATNDNTDEIRSRYTEFLNRTYIPPKGLQKLESHYENIEKTVENIEDALKPSSIISLKDDYIRFVKSKLHEGLLNFNIYIANWFLQSNT
ncbi:hypothetical protein [Clostridium manihotivorum]|uniref:Uncharacterized protein n=1 Tax=Clostridium manihotivorum TaxID=2320868 RepID=A0A3R5QQX3_9CLOT|nr:hypothetical protein [Clostridium manihotivorum]QAA30362.1 hypothetical protein C1I91_00940 [Clostridium manihotivorum]